MEYKEILDLVNTLVCELDDAYNCLPDYNANESGKTTLGQAEHYLDITKDKLEHIIEKELS